MDIQEAFSEIVTKFSDTLPSKFKNAWSTYSTFFSRFDIKGFKKFLAEFFSEMMTIGTAGACVMLVLAMPAFEKAEEDWKSKGQFSVTFLDRYGTEIGKRGILHNDTIPLADIPDYVIKATLSTEDRRFFEHYGIDPWGTLRALYTNAVAGGVVQGGSTLTQQLAKNLFLTNERSLQRKVNEAFLSFWLETHLTKKEILQEYFNRAYMGGGAYGIEAGAQFYFNKSIRDVNLAQAAMLAGLFKSPTGYAPHRHLPKARERANEVLTNMVQAKFLTEGQVHESRIHPARAVQRPARYEPGYFLDWAFQEVKRIMKDKGDYVLIVKTTVDLDLQRSAERIVSRMLRMNGRSYRASQAAMVAMEAHTGAVRVIVGGRNYARSQFNRATNGKRQPGSSIKPYVYLTAVQRLNMSPYSRVLDSPNTRCKNGYSPKNAGGRYRGRIPLWLALQKSINTVAIYLANRAGRKNIVRNLERIGIKGIKPGCTMPLGSGAISIIKHVSGYAIFPTGGLRVPDYVVSEIRNSAGELVYSQERDGEKIHRVFQKRHIITMNRMMRNVVLKGGTAPRANLSFTMCAGKTGTTNRSRDAWFMGFTGRYVAGVWFGNDNNSPMISKSYGGKLPATTWKNFMTVAHTDPNIPKIPGLKIHPAQRGRMSALEASKAADPSIGKSASIGRGLSEGSRLVLQNIAHTMKAASKINKTAIEKDKYVFKGKSQGPRD